MPLTPEQRSENARKAGVAAQDKRRQAEAAAAKAARAAADTASVDPNLAGATKSPGSKETVFDKLEPTWVVKQFFKFMHDGMAKVTGIKELEDKPAESDVAATLTVGSLELVEAVWLVRYLMPLAMVAIFGFMEVPRVMVLVEHYRIRRIEKEIELRRMEAELAEAHVVHGSPPSPPFQAPAEEQAVPPSEPPTRGNGTGRPASAGPIQGVVPRPIVMD